MIDYTVGKHEVFVTTSVSIWWPAERKGWNDQKIWGKFDSWNTFTV